MRILPTLTNWRHVASESGACRKVIAVTPGIRRRQPSLSDAATP
jgi:hypothetical protein